MAGAGSRFAKEGYKDPKPLIPVDNLPMIVRAVEDLPPSDEYIFICRSEHLKDYPLQKTLEKYYPGCKIIDIDYLTEGQASTCLLAAPYLKKSQALLIGACDNGMVYDSEKWKKVTKDKSVDGLAITFRNNVNVERNPNAWGWVAVGEDGVTIKKVSVKVPVSDDPINDHAIVGAFWFRKAEHFLAAADDMIKKDQRINNEFYVDQLVNNAIGLGLNMQVFEVDKYIGWGTPNDLKTYLYWKEYFEAENAGKNPNLGTKA